MGSAKLKSPLSNLIALELPWVKNDADISTLKSNKPKDLKFEGCMD